MFEVSTQNFVKAVEQTISVVASKNIKPILAGVKIEVKDSSLLITATDMGNAIDLSVPLLSCGNNEIDSFVVDAKGIYEIAKSLPGEIMKFEFNEQSCTITADAKVTIPVMSSVDFPEPLQVLHGEILDLPKDKFIETCKKIIPFTSNDEYIQQFQNILFELKAGKLTLVAADGFRLAVANLEVDVDKVPEKLVGEEILVSKKTLLKIMDIVGSMEEEVFTLEISPKTVCVRTKNSIFKARLIDNKFPDYKQIIPSGFSTTVAITQEEFLKRFKIVEVFTKKTGESVKFKLRQDGMEASARGLDKGETLVHLPATVQGELFEVGYNPKYISECIKLFNKEGEILLKFVDPAKGVTIQQDEGYFQIVMPLKLRG